MWTDEGDRYSEAPFMGPLQIVTYAYQILMLIVLLQLVLGVSLYVIARWRHYRENQPTDPHFGLKYALSLFRTIAHQGMLWGLFFIAFAAFSTEGPEGKLETLRIGFGVFTPCAVVYGVHLVLLATTNAKLAPTVTRLFRGVSLVFTGLVGFVAVLVTMFLWFQKNPDKELVRVGYALLVVFGVAWIVEGALMARSVKIVGFPGGGTYGETPD